MNQRDVTPIAIITAVVTQTGSGPPPVYAITTLTSSDMRRYTTNGSGGLSAFTLGPDAAFRSFTSAINWATQTTSMVSATNNTNDIVFSKFMVNGPITIPSTSEQITFDFNSNVIFDGSNGGTINIDLNQAFLLFENVTFTNITFNVSVITAFLMDSNISFIDNVFNYNYDPVFVSDLNYNSSTDNVNSTGGLMYRFAFNFTDINIIGNEFIWQSPNPVAAAVNRYPFISYQFGNIKPWIRM